MGNRKDDNRTEKKLRAIEEAIQKNDLATSRTDSMISRITLRDVATFDHGGVTLEDLQRVNFIYGGNGCGKTTLSRFLASVSRQKGQGQQIRGKSQFKNCEVEWTGMPLKVLVYNRDFREKNLVENIPGVFTLGADSVEAGKKVLQLQHELDQQNMDLKSKQRRIESRERQIRQDMSRLRDTLWNEVLMQQAEYFSEILANGNGKAVVTSKAQFAKQMMAMVEDGRYRKALSRESLQERYRTLYRGEQLTAMEKQRKPESELAEILEVTENEIWQRCIVATDTEVEKCPLCGQMVVTDEQKQQQSKYKEAVDKIRELKDEYKEQGDRLKEKLYGLLAICQMAPGAISKHVEVMRMMTEIVRDRIDTNYRIMANKQENPGMMAQFKDVANTAESLWKLIDETNDEIDEHNKVVENREPEKERLKEDLLTYLAGRSASTVKYCEQSIAQKRADLVVLHQEADEIVKKTQVLVEKIKELEKKLASTKPTVDRMNNQLKRYDITGFSIQPSKKGNYYQIQREDGSLVKDTLSEGETTAITFLYFMQLVKGSETNSSVREKKVVVIDDPISSLDKDAIGMVCDMVKPMIDQVKRYDLGGLSVDINQLFVLTHNVEFHKSITRPSPRGNKHRACHHWELYKDGGVSQAMSYGMENPIGCGYEQQWQELKESRRGSMTLPNIMRDIIDDYFVKFGGYSKNTLIDELFGEDEDEKAKMNELYEWTNNGSHGSSDARYAEAQLAANRKYLERFKRFFEKSGHGAHYEMMMREESKKGKDDGKG